MSDKHHEQYEATPDDVRRWSAGLPDEFLMCRDFGHLWRPYTAKYNSDNNTYDRTLRCGRCYTERNQAISMSGVVLSGGYHYADGYQAPHGQGRLSGNARGALRVESILRVIGHDEGNTPKRKRGK